MVLLNLLVVRQHMQAQFCRPSPISRPRMERQKNPPAWRLMHVAGCCMLWCFMIFHHPRCSMYGIFTYIDFPKLPFFLVNGPVSFSEWTWGMFLCCYNFFVQVAIQRESSSTSKLWFPIGISFSSGLFSGAMLVLGRVSLHPGRLRGLEDDVPFSQLGDFLGSMSIFRGVFQIPEIPADESRWNSLPCFCVNTCFKSQVLPFNFEP